VVYIRGIGSIRQHISVFASLCTVTKFGHDNMAGLGNIHGGFAHTSTLIN